MADEAERASEAEQEVGRINAFFPILPRLGNRMAGSRPWEGLTLGLNLHLTTLTAVLLRELQLGGGTFVVSAANPATTDLRVVEMLRNQGIEVYTGGDMEDRHAQVLMHKPQLIVDVGFHLIAKALELRSTDAAELRGAIELTASGITRLRTHEGVHGPAPFPIVNINDGRLKNAVENRHGVGEAIWTAVSQLTGMYLAGRRLAVIGYGPVGKGLALHARAAGMNVEVIEQDAVRQLFAHYDGFPTPSLDSAMRRAGIVVTATGRTNVLRNDMLAEARDNIVLVNAGTGGDEIDVAGIRKAAESVDNIAPQVVRYRMANGRRVTVLADGHPLNIVLNSGSPEPVLLHFTVLGLALERLASQSNFANGEVRVPDEIERAAALFALESLNLSSI